MKLWMHLLEIEITTKCNLNCKHCYNRENKNIDMPLDEIIYYLNFANKFNVKKIVISGGEACIHKDFNKLCDYLLENRKKLNNVEKIVLQSNGLIGKIDLTKLKGFDMIHLSFDVDNNDARLINSKKTLELANNIKKNGMNCYLFATIHNKNINYIDEIVKLANESNNQIAFNLCCDTGKNSEFLLTREQKISTINKLLQYEKEGKINKLKHPYVNSLKGLSCEDYRIKGGCTAGIATCTILANGDVIPCPFLRVKAGNIHVNKLEDIWLKSELFNSLRNRNKYDICGKCRFISYCGGCRKSAYESSKSIHGMDLNCIINGDIKVRKATISDINSIVKIKINSWKETYKNIINDEFLDNMDYDENFKKFYNEIKNPDSIKQNYVITKNDKVIGYTKFQLLENNEYDSQICAIYIDNKYKGKGYGTILLNYVKNLLKNSNCTNMILWCIYRNYPSRKFYLKKGGKEGKKIKSKIGNQNIYEISYIYELQEGGEIDGNLANGC